MIRFLLRLSLCTAALAAVTTAVAHAADVELPLPEMHGTSTGPYVGAFVMDGHREPELRLWRPALIHCFKKLW
jgi:hypothetical protein